MQTFDNLEGEILLLLGFPAVTHSHTQAAAAGLPVIVGWLKEGKLITKEPVYLGDSSGRLSQKKLFRADATQLSLELVGTTTFHCTSRFSPLGVQVYTLYIVQLCVTNN